MTGLPPVKITSGVTTSNQYEIKEHTKQLARGFRPDPTKTKKARCGPNEYTVITYTNRPQGQDAFGSAERITSAAKGAVEAVGTLGLGLLNEGVRDNFEMAKNGEVVHKVYFANEDVLAKERSGKSKSGVSKLEKRMGFDNTNPKSVAAFVKRPEIKAQLVYSHGHAFLKQQYYGARGDGSSNFIFLPNGDPDKARSITFWWTESGKSIEDPTEYEKAIHSFCASYNQGKEGLAEQMKSSVTKLAEAKGYDPLMLTPKQHDELLDELIECYSAIRTLRQDRGLISFTPDRLLRDTNNLLAATKTTFGPGKNVKVGEDVEKSWLNIYTGQVGDRLGSYKPYAKPPQEENGKEEIGPPKEPYAEWS